jgi:chromate reductase, NAD(P)H dehydrogenase (quinone)
MSTAPQVAVVVGSLRKDSWSAKLARALMQSARGRLACEVVPIGSLALYNEDLEERVPQEWDSFRRSIDRSEAVLFVTPEYNRSIPGGLKNAIDVGSRPEGKNHWSGKAAGVLSQTPHQLGAFGANHALRQTFVFLDMPVLQQPEFYVSRIADKFDDGGNIKDAETLKLIDQFIDTFATWVRRLRDKST